MAESARHKTSRPVKETPQPASFEARFVQAGGVKLHYLDYGTQGKPIMLCVHGSAAHAHWFDFVAPGFTSDYQVLSIDLRGHGDSEWVRPPNYYYQDYAADLNAAAEALDLRDFVLIGHSMGGAVSLTYAAMYPGRSKSLTVIDSTVNLSAERINQMREVGSRPGRDFASKEELVSRYKLRPGHSLATPEIVRYIASHSAREFEGGAWRYKFDREVYATREVVDCRPSWNKIKTPALLMKGDHSDRLTPDVVADVKERCPQVEFVEIAGSDHHVPLDSPQLFIQAMKAFLARNP
ncbi:MAG: alpha/beta hydrolase [Pseudomonadota bacterium]